jgi:lipopolysaccharide export system permease protein
MKTLDRYILGKVLSTFFFVVLMLTAIILVIDVTEKMDKFARNNLPFSVILGYYGDFIPWIAGLLTPITIFISIVFVTARLAAHSEIIAILSGGVSFRRFLVPYFIASTIIAGISFVLNGWIIPRSNRDRVAFELKYFENKTFYDKRNVHMQVAPNVYMFLQNFNNQSNTGYLFTLEKFDQNRLVEKLSADNITWDTVASKWKLRNWTLKEVDQIFSDSAALDKKTRTGQWMDTVLSVTPKDFENESRQYDGMTIGELQRHIAKMKFRGMTGVENYQTELYIRFSAPFTAFVLVFMGVIVSSRKARGGTGFQIALGFFLSFVFILFFILSRTFAEAGSLSPWLAAWIPNIIFGMISGFMYKYVPR